MLLGNYHFGQQDYAAAIAEYKKATAINPAFSQPYNQLGYAYRFLGKYAEAEQAFKKYIELIPDDPNPYDSYAELLMKIGRFDESIKSYEKALSFDPNFVASYIGIGNDHVFLGKRRGRARPTPSSRRRAQRRRAAARRSSGRRCPTSTRAPRTRRSPRSTRWRRSRRRTTTMAALSGDANLAGNILLEAGDTDKAAVRFKQAVATIDKADVPGRGQGSHPSDRPLRQGARGAGEARRPGREVEGRRIRPGCAAAKPIPFEARRGHELAGRIALETKDYAAALRSCAGEPAGPARLLPDRAGAFQGKGDAAKAKEACTRAADLNELNVNYAYVRGKAKALLSKL